MTTTLNVTARVEANDGTIARTVNHYETGAYSTAGSVASAPGVAAIATTETEVELPYGPGLVRLVNVGANLIEFGFATGDRPLLAPPGIPIILVLKDTVTSLFALAATATTDLAIDAWEAAP